MSVGLQRLREEPDVIRDGAIRKGEDPALVDRALGLDAERRRLLAETEALKAERNAASKQIGEAIKAGAAPDGPEVADLRASSTAAGERITALDAALAETEADLDDLLLRIPNPPDPDIPVGGEEANVTIRLWGDQLPREQPFTGEVGADAPAGGATWTRRPHWELGEALDILDNARGAKITGSGFPVYKGAGSALQRALINWFLDVHTRENGMTEVWPPAVVNTASATGTGQIPDKEDQMYVVTRDELYLVPTAEVPVTNLHRDEILEASDLPIRYAAYTPCFRREAGAAGKDTRGILRVHQFDKVEMVLFEQPEDSAAALEWMTERAELLLQRLGLAYRVLLMSTREMGFTQARKYDLEVWSPGVERWLEVSSCSNFRDFQARRMAIRYRPEQGAKPELVHTLNGSGLALARVVAAILETYQQPDGSIAVPEPLRPYMGRDAITVRLSRHSQAPSRRRPRTAARRDDRPAAALRPRPASANPGCRQERHRAERVMVEAVARAKMRRRLPRPGETAGRTRAGRSAAGTGTRRACRTARRAAARSRRRRGSRRRRTDRSRAAEGPVLRVVEAAHRDQDQVDEVPDPAPAERDQLEDAEPGIAEIEAVDPEPADEERDQERGQPVLVGEDARDLRGEEPRSGAVSPLDHRVGLDVARPRLRLEILERERTLLGPHALDDERGRRRHGRSPSRRFPDGQDGPEDNPLVAPMKPASLVSSRPERWPSG